MPAKRLYWTSDDDALLAELYPDTPMPDLEARLGKPKNAIYYRANRLGIKRSEQYLQSEHACRLRRGDNVGAEHRFKPGHKSWNSGKKGFQAGGKSVETQFKAGTMPHNWQPVGSERITEDGIRQRKVTDEGPPHRRWKAVHALLWEEVNGPIPRGHLVVFKDRNRENITLENLELITRAENCQRNTIHRYPPELKEIIRLQKKLERKVKDASHEKQNDRPAQSPVCNP